MPELKSSYTAENVSSINRIRKNFDIFKLANKIGKRGDSKLLSKKIDISKGVVSQMRDEARILSNFPSIEKSKSNPLSRLKTDRELRLFSYKYNIWKLQVRDLTKKVKKWNEDIQENPLKVLTQKEHDIIIGTLLGDASIRKRERYSCLRFSHSIKQKAYFYWKVNKLIDLPISELRESYRTIGDKRNVHMLNFSTRTHPIFNYYRYLFYKSKKTINKKLLENLNPRSLAIWICDDGSFDRTQGYIVLCTNSFSLKEHELMKKCFNKKFGLDPTIGFRDKKYYYLRFKQEDSKKLIEIVRPFIPRCMKYKIGEENG
tara:strand:- start:172 stop:1119 length:948 start_codon:yes stop_codon:yes gene_type:complete